MDWLAEGGQCYPMLWAATLESIPNGPWTDFLKCGFFLCHHRSCPYHSYPSVFSAQQPQLSFKMFIRSCHISAQNLLMVSHLRANVKSPWPVRFCITLMPPPSPISLLTSHTLLSLTLWLLPPYVFRTLQTCSCFRVFLLAIFSAWNPLPSDISAWLTVLPLCSNTTLSVKLSLTTV